MKRVIFLDFDGVLNTGNYTKKLIADGKPYRDEFGELFDPEAIHNLQIVLEAVPDALLVITSSWKDVFAPAAIRRLWKERCFPGKIHSMTRMCMPAFLNEDNEPTMALIKGPEVEQWIEEHEMKGCSYVIFDDVEDFLPKHKKHLVKINPNTGITAKDAKRAIKLLCNEETCNRKTR